jgi:hypothetical protein
MILDRRILKVKVLKYLELRTKTLSRTEQEFMKKIKHMIILLKKAHPRTLPSMKGGWLGYLSTTI